MTRIDQRIADALQRDAPPPRDPAFRYQVLERREQQRFRRRALGSLAAAAAVAVVSALSITAGGESYTAGSVLLFALVLVLGGVVYLPGFGRLMRHFSV
jgi:hypothetical protein